MGAPHTEVLSSHHHHFDSLLCYSQCYCEEYFDFPISQVLSTPNLPDRSASNQVQKLTLKESGGKVNNNH